MQPDDQEVVARAKAGDEGAFRLLVDRHSRALYHVAFRMTGRKEDAEDVVQETFVRAFRQLGRFEARAAFSTWLHRIGVNCAIDYLRRRPKREAPEPELGLDQLPMVGVPTVEDRVYAGEIQSRMQQALEGLSAQERAAFLLRHYHGCSIGDICTELGINDNAAKHAVFRGVRKMRDALRSLMPEPAHTK